jgi:transketolase
MRNVFIDCLIQEAKVNEKILLITADLGYGVVDKFRTEFPERFFNLGVAEQSIMSIAAGLASKGFRPFVYSIGNFPTFRCMEQIRNDVSYMNNGVVIVALGAGFSYGTAGYSHYLIEDIPSFRSLENIEIFNPATAEQVSEITSVLAHGTAPAYLRIGSLEELKPKAIGEIADFGEILYFGTSGSILVTGPLVTEAVEARKILAEQGHDLGIISVFNLSRFRLAEIQKVCPGPYVSVEEHRIKGGFNSMLLEEANFLRNGVGISGVGIQHFEHSKIGNRNYMLEKYGVTAINIVNAFNLLLD